MPGEKRRGALPKEKNVRIQWQGVLGNVDCQGISSGLAEGEDSTAKKPQALVKGKESVAGTCRPQKTAAIDLNRCFVQLLTIGYYHGSRI
jgi:hypothetical protein